MRHEVKNCVLAALAQLDSIQHDHDHEQPALQQGSVLQQGSGSVLAAASINGSFKGSSGGGSLSRGRGGGGSGGGGSGGEGSGGGGSGSGAAAQPAVGGSFLEDEPFRRSPSSSEQLGAFLPSSPAPGRAADGPSSSFRRARSRLPEQLDIMRAGLNQTLDTVLSQAMAREVVHGVYVARTVAVKVDD